MLNITEKIFYNGYLCACLYSLMFSTPLPFLFLRKFGGETTVKSYQQHFL